MNDTSHWESVYRSRASDSVSWYRPHLDRSLAFIDALRLDADAPVIDVGAGASTLADDLLARGYRGLHLNDMADAALAHVRVRLSADAPVCYHVGDITSIALPSSHFALWHDRAVFHFLTDAAQRDAYVAQAARAVFASGFLLIATFAEDGPERCSGLPVQRYDAQALAAVFATHFETREAARDMHHTPAGGTQAFQYLLMQRR